MRSQMGSKGSSPYNPFPRPPPPPPHPTKANNSFFLNWQIDTACATDQLILELTSAAMNEVVILREIASQDRKNTSHFSFDWEVHAPIKHKLKRLFKFSMQHCRPIPSRNKRRHPHKSYSLERYIFIQHPCLSSVRFCFSKKVTIY